MGRKRADGEGTIGKRKDGTWYAALTVGYDTDGKPQRKWAYGTSQEQVKQKLNELKQQVFQGVSFNHNDLSFSDWVDTWLLEYKKPTVKPSTYESYHFIATGHIMPEFKKIKLTALNGTHIQKLLNKKQKEISKTGNPLSSRTVKYIYDIINFACKQAVQLNLILKNPAEGAVPPKLEQKETTALTSDQRKSLLQVIKGERLRTAFILDMGTGLRVGELLGLQWKDIDFEVGTLQVSRTIKRVSIFDDSNKRIGSELITQIPKTKTGRRTIPLSAPLLGELELHYKKQAAEKLKAGQLFEDQGFVFCSELGKPIDPRNILRKFHSLCKKAEIPKMPIHYLRHTFATMLLENGENYRLISELLGHTKVSFTMQIYTHTTTENKKNAIDKLTNMLSIAN